jgi:FlaA1/EpsC-like NDP-sugar epimerase
MILEGKTILVTGGTGSMGKTFVKRALGGQNGLPKKIIVLSRDEAKQHYMRQAYLQKQVSTDEVIYKNFMQLLEFRIGDVRNYGDVCQALQGVDYVINAAALKQVPVCEYFPEQALRTNCEGAHNIVRAIRELNLPVEKVIGVSTDKACKPVNVMGMTKALQERIFISANVLCKQTSFVCVRYGNVLASRGSVIPLFHDQIKAGGPLTVTDEKMTRFLLSLEDAVDTVLAALENGRPGETFIPNAPSANILEIARALTQANQIPIKITGIRPGEKMHEILISDEEAFRTYRNGAYYVIQPMLPELIPGQKMRTADLITEYSSKDFVLDFQGTYDLLAKNKLLVAFDEAPEKSELVG